jgi:hypothetical protein
MYAPNLFTKDSSAVVEAQIINHQAIGAVDYLPLEVVTIRGSQEVQHKTLHIKLRTEVETREPDESEIARDSVGIISLANGVRIAHCITEDGRRIDVWLGKPEEREERAFVLIEVK